MEAYQREKNSLNLVGATTAGALMLMLMKLPLLAINILVVLTTVEHSIGQLPGLCTLKRLGLGASGAMTALKSNRSRHRLRVL